MREGLHCVWLETLFQIVADICMMATLLSYRHDFGIINLQSKFYIVGIQNLEQTMVSQE